MRTLNLFLSSLSLLFILFLALTGVILLLLANSSEFKGLFLALVHESSSLFTLSGSLLIVLSVCLAMSLSGLTSKKYLEIKMGKNRISIDEHLVEQLLQGFWQSLYPEKDIPQQVLVKKNKIEVIVALPATAEEKQQNLLAKIETHISHLFEDKLGYTDEFILLVNFEAPQHS